MRAEVAKILRLERTFVVEEEQALVEMHQPA
jgi:hypothetical protein